MNLNQKVTELLCKGGRVDELSQMVIDAVRHEDMKDKQPGGAGGGEPVLGVTVGVADGRDTVFKATIPPDVYWSEVNQDFRSAVTGRSCGEEFCNRWFNRRTEFRGGGHWNDRPPSLREVEQYVPNGTPLTDHERELLVILMEEAAEVIQAASKLIRFGRESRPPRPDVLTADDPRVLVGPANTQVLGLEVGDLQHMINVVQACELVSPTDVAAGSKRKGERLLKYLQTKPFSPAGN